MDTPKVEIWDTPQTALNKLAYSVGVLPRWIYIDSSEHILNYPDIKVSNLRDDILSAGDKIPIQLYKDLSTKYPNVSEVEFVSLLLNSNYKEALQDDNILFATVVSKFNDFDSMNTLEKVKRGLQTFKLNVNRDHGMLKQSIEEQTNHDNIMRKILKKIPESTPINIIKTTKSQIMVLSEEIEQSTLYSARKADLSGYGLLSIFNNAITSIQVPYMYLSVFLDVDIPLGQLKDIPLGQLKDRTLIKLHKATIPKEEWMTDFADRKKVIDKQLRIKGKVVPNSIRVKILSSNIQSKEAYNYPKFNILPNGKIVSQNIMSYIDASISPSSDNLSGQLKDNKYIISMKFPSIKSGIKDEDMQRYFELVKFGIFKPVSSIKDTELSIVFYVLNITTIQYAFNEGITNDPILSKYMFINETSVPSSKRVNVQALFYHHTDDEIITDFKIIIHNKLTETSDVSVSGKKIPKNTNYLEVIVSKLSGIYLEQLESRTKPLILMMIKRYKEIEKEIINQYSVIKIKKGHVTPLTEIPSRKALTKLDKLKTTAPYLFLPHIYAKNLCTSQIKQPEIITDEEAGTTDHIVMKFPIKGEKSLVTGEIYPTHNYICTSREYSYPGLRHNFLTAPNYNEFAYVPCCFKLDQERKTSPYREYFMSEAPSQKKVSSYVLKTFKFLQPGRTGELPIDIQDFLRASSGHRPEAGIKEGVFLRYGCYGSFSSIIHCILAAKNPDTYKGDEKTEKRVHNIRRNILKKVFIEMSAPNIIPVDNTGDNISQILLKSSKEFADPKVYLDPKKYHAILTDYFKINLVLLERTADHPDGTLMIPYHLQTIPYMHREHSNYPTIVIYEHLGAEKDYAKYPISELIVIDRESTFDLNFGPQMYKNYLKGLMLMTKVIFPQESYNRLYKPPSINNILNQILEDTTGYCICYTIGTDKGPIMVLPERPILPLNAEYRDRYTIEDINKISIKSVDMIEVLRSAHGSKVTYVIKSSARCIAIKIGTNIPVYIPVHPPIPIPEGSVTEFSTIRYSKILKLRLKDNIPGNNTYNISENNKRISTTLLLKYIKNVLHSGNIPGSSQKEIENRLLYHLKLLKANNQITDRFALSLLMDITNIAPTEILFRSIRSFSMYINERYSHGMTVSDKLSILKSGDPYLFQKKDFEFGSYFLIQSTLKDKGIHRSLSLGYIWKEYKINTGYLTTPKHPSNLKYRLYDITEENTLIEGEMDTSSIVIITDGIDYATLLSIIN